MANSIANVDFHMKLLLIGDSNVGKTSLLQRFVDGTFQEIYTTTIASDFKVHNVKLDGKAVRIQIWDTAGMERFRTITSSYYRSAHGILIVFDVNSLQSFENVRKWMSEIERYASPNVNLLLVGNKSDLKGPNTVDAKQVKEYCQSLKLAYAETSAKSDRAVSELFLSLCRVILKRVSDETANKYNHQPVPSSPVYLLSDTRRGRSNNDSSSCCP